MTKEEFLQTGLMELYCLGLTSEEEGKLVEDMVAKYPELKNKGKGIHECMEKYAKKNAIPCGGKGTSKRLMEECTSRKNIVFSKGAVIAVTLGCAGLLVFGVSNWNSEKMTNEDQTILSTNFKTANATEKPSSQNAFFKDPQTIQLPLKGTIETPNASAVVFWNKHKSTAFLKIKNLAPPTAEEEYHLWADIDNRMVSLGNLDFKNKGLRKIPFLAHVDRICVTMQKRSGSGQPDVSQLIMEGRFE